MQQNIRVSLPLKHEVVETVARAVVASPYQTVDRSEIARLFPKDFVPGTFLVSERKDAPDFLYDDTEPDYRQWLSGMIRSHLAALDSSLPSRSAFPFFFAHELEKAVEDVFDHHLNGGKRICELITNQQATDITWRYVNVVCRGDPYAPNKAMEAFNRIGRRYALELLRRMRPKEPELAIQLSVIAGAIGVDLKTRYVACGPSRVVSDGVIALGDEMNPHSVETIESELESRLRRRFAIDDVIPFLEDVYCMPRVVRAVLFTDDLIETIFDLYWVQRLLETDDNLNVFLVPRWGEYANDASFADILSLLSEPLFEHLKSLKGIRLHVVPHGPAGSAVNPFEFSTEVARVVDSADCLLFKGARAYEMLQGIKKLAYFGFNVLRSYSESLTGLNAKSCPSVFIRQLPGIPTFCDFKARAYRKKAFSGGRVVGVARMTAVEYCDAVRRIEQRISGAGRGNLQQLASSALHRADRAGRTFAEVVLREE